MTPNGEEFALVAGFRRFMALRHLGWEEVPCLVMATLGDEQAVEFTLLENVTHKSLDVISEARAMERAFPSATHSQRDIAPD